MLFRYPQHYAWRIWSAASADPALIWQQIRLLGLMQRNHLQLLDEILGDLSQAASDRLERLDELLEDDAGMAREFEEPVYLPLPADEITAVARE